MLRTPPEAAIDPLATTSHLLSLAAVQVWLPQLDPLCLRTGARREPQALPPTEATGNLSEKAQVAGRQARGPEADRLLTLEHTGSETRALTGEDAVETTSSHPGPVLRLPPAWPLGCGADDVPAFCLVCFHREDEELEEVPLQRSVLGWAAGWQDHGAALPWAYRPAMMLMGPLRPLSPPSTIPPSSLAVTTTFSSPLLLWS